MNNNFFLTHHPTHQVPKTLPDCSKTGPETKTTTILPTSTQQQQPRIIIVTCRWRKIHSLCWRNGCSTMPPPPPRLKIIIKIFSTSPYKLIILHQPLFSFIFIPISKLIVVCFLLLIVIN